MKLKRCIQLTKEEKTLLETTAQMLQNFLDNTDGDDLDKVIDDCAYNDTDDAIQLLRDIISISEVVEEDK